MTYGVLSVVAVVLCSPLLIALVQMRYRSALAEELRSDDVPQRPRLRIAPSRPRPTVSVVIPALNEEGAVKWVLEQIPAWVSEIVLVDGRSVDGTEVVARDVAPELVVVHQPKPGKGAALRAGFAAATGEIIVMLDSDGSTDPAEMERFIEALQDGAQFVKGSRHMSGGGSADLTMLRGVGNRTLVAVVNRLFGCSFTDLCYGYCAFWRRHLPALDVAADGFEIETQLILSAVRAGLRIREIPSMELPRLAGASNLNAFRDGRRVLATIIDSRLRHNAALRAQQRELALVPVQIASPGSAEWVPAGKDRRRIERRVLDPAAAGYTGPERRREDRRRPPSITVTVYRALEREREPVTAPEIGHMPPIQPYPVEEPAPAAI
jgi:hypothetical protein